MPDHNWIQVHKRSYDVLSVLVRSGFALPNHRQLCGVADAGTWRITAPADLTILSDESLSIAGHVVYAQLGRLPTHTYQALVAGSPSFTQYDGLDDLYQSVRQPQEGFNPAVFKRQLEESVRAGRRPDLQPRLVVTPTTYAARWRPDGVYLRLDQNGNWFLALMFDVQHHPGRRHAVPVPVGLDLGWRPMTVAHTGAGESRTFNSSDLRHLRSVAHSDLTPEARRLLATLAYASGREDAQAVIAYLNWRANRVYAERLTLHRMQSGYVQRARATAIHDHHFSHLPQFMFAAKLLFRRVPSYYTSQRCSSCYEKDGVTVHGDRQGDFLTCHRCHRTYGSHQVAAHNVCLEGEERYRAGQFG
jgi:hypothetical protein